MKGKMMMHPEFHLYEVHGKPRCSSLQIAETFKKEHKNVLRDIETKILSVAPKDFTELNFELSNYTDETGRKNKRYMLTRDGFNLVVMGFTGEKAMQWKVDFIRRFNQMESFIVSLYAAKLEHPAFTRAVMESHDEPKSYHFSNESDMINRIVLGCPAKDIRELHGLEKGESIRPYLTGIQLADIRALQLADVGLMIGGHSFQQRKEILTDYHQRRKIIELSA